MGRLTSTLESVQDKPVLPKDVYKVRIDSINVTTSKVKEDGTGGNPMLNVVYKVLEGPYAGSSVPSYPDSVMIGGRQKDGQTMNTFRLAQLIEAFGLPWGCLNCNSGDRQTGFIRGTAENGLAIGRYHCPDCKSVPSMTYDTDQWIGAIGQVAVDVEKPEGRDREQNRVVSYARA